MKRLMIVAALAFVFSGAAVGQVQHQQVPLRAGQPCVRPDGRPVLFTVRMAERAWRAVWAGERRVHAGELRLLARVARCQQNPEASRFVRAFGRAQKRAHAARVHRTVYEQRLARSLSYADASWYDDAGSTACGFHAGYGVANKTLACGTRVLFVYGGRSVEATVDDRGPFAGDRVWDLNQNVAGALGFGGVHVIGYRVG